MRIVNRRRACQELDMAGRFGGLIRRITAEFERGRPNGHRARTTVALSVTARPAGRFVRARLATERSAKTNALSVAWSYV